MMSKFSLVTMNQLEGIALAGHLEKAGHSLTVILPSEIQSQTRAIRTSSVNLVDVDSVIDSEDTSRTMLKIQSGAPVVWLANTLNEPLRIYESIASGASGCLCKEDLSELAPSLERVERGHFLYDKTLLMSFLRQIAPMATPLPSLDRQEYELLNLLQLGYSNTEIADIMDISVQFVKRQVAHLKEVMHAKRRRQLSLGLVLGDLNKMVT